MTTARQNGADGAGDVASPASIRGVATAMTPSESAPSGAARPCAPRDANGAAAPKVAVVLGAGAARGWSHIGALEALADLGIKPTIVAGCSSGALVAAAYAAGRLDALKSFAESLSWRGMLGYFDFSWRGGGLIEGRWVGDLLRETLGDPAIEELPLAYGAVATELATGRETWFTRGSLVDSVRASIALPGLMAPIAIDGRWMTDGALVNPIPVSLCRSLGAEIIIGVSMSGDLVTLGRGPLALPARADQPPPDEAAPNLAAARRAMKTNNPTPADPGWLAWMMGAGRWSSYWAGAASAETSAAPPPPTPRGRPGYFEVMGQSFFTVQNFVTRVRLAADPVDVLIAPEVSTIGIMDFHRGAEAIAAGRAAVEAEAARITALCPPPALAPPEPAPLDPAAASDLA